MSCEGVWLRLLPQLPSKHFIPRLHIFSYNSMYQKQMLSDHLTSWLCLSKMAACLISCDVGESFSFQKNVMQSNQNLEDMLCQFHGLDQIYLFHEDRVCILSMKSILFQFLFMIQKFSHEYNMLITTFRV